MRYVIIGGSAAAIGCIEGVRSVDKTGEIILITGETEWNYSRPLISYLLEGKTTRDKMWCRPDSFFTRNGVTVKAGVLATALDAGDRTVRLSTGERLAYDRLLAATGCDGVAVGRGAMGNPWLFGQIAAAMECREVPPPPSLHERFRVLRRHIYDMCEDKGEYIAMQQARTHAAWYMHGLRGAATLRRECCGMLHFTDLDRVIEHAWELQRETR